MVAALMALLLVLQGLLVSGGTMAYALDGDSGQTGGDAVRTEVRGWSSDARLSGHGTLEGGAFGITPTAQLAWDGEDVAERQLTEAAFCALADDEEADVPATVTLSLKMDAPEGEVLLAGDTVSLSAQTDDGVVKLDDTAAAITLYEPDATGAATGRAVASANVAGGKLNITLLESAFDAEEEAVALGADAGTTTEDQAIADEAATDQAIADDAAVVDQAATEQAAAKSADVQEQAAPAHGDAVAMVGAFEATVDASALSADGTDAAGTQHEWTLLAWNGQALSKTTLVVPTMDQAVATLRDADAFVEDKGADEGESEDGSLGKENGSVVLTDPAGGAASYELTGSTQATLTTVWCDNNDVNRPVAGSKYIFCFTLTPEGSSESVEYRLPEDAVKLGLDSTSLPAWATGVSTVRTETSTYVSMASDLPTTLAVTTGTDLGQSQTIYHIAWQLKDEAVYQDADGSLRYLRTADDDGSNTQYLQLLAEVEFHVVGHIGGAKPTDVFQEAQSANHGTKYDGAYPNGTMTLIHVGTMQFGNAVNAAAPDDADSDAYATVEPVASSDPAEGDSSDQAGVQQTFANELLTTSLAGTKTWDDYGSGIVARFGDDEVPELVLWRSVSGQDADGASFSTEDEAPVSPTPTWTKSEDGLAWTYIYEGLPQVDEYGNPYTCWVEEARGSVPGFHPVYSEDHQATEVGSDKGEQTAVAFENVASRFALDKVSEVKEDDGSFIQLNDVELAVVSWTDRNVYAVWQRDTSGTEKSYVWPSGQSIGAVWPDGIGSGNANTEGSIEMTGANAGYIIGLPAGEYRIMESAPAPENHAMAEDVAIAIDWDGTVSKYDQNGDSVTNDTVSTVDDVTTVSVVDEVFRAHFNIHKTIERDTGEIDGLGDVTFELHRNDAATPEREGTLLTKGIVTGEDGDWESQVEGADVLFERDVLVDRFYTRLSDGLPPGDYYLKEVSAPTGVTLPTGEDARTYFTITQADGSSEGDHGKTVMFWVENNKFHASAQIPKFDSISGDPVAGAEFKLEYWAGKSDAASSEGDPTSTRVVATDESGMLLLGGLEQGFYYLTETAAAEGYVLGDDPFQATFVIEDGDEDRSFDFMNETDRAEVSFTKVSGRFDEQLGIPNDRYNNDLSEVKIKKVDDSDSAIALNGAVFELQMESRFVDDIWRTVATGLVTGRGYTLNEDNSAIASDAKEEEGILRVINLLWGKYRLVETAPAPGHHMDQGEKVVKEFEVQRQNNGGTDDAAYKVNLTTEPIVNRQNVFELKKTNEDEELLKDAVFEIKPVSPGTFADGTTEPKRATTDEQGTLNFNGMLVVGTKYQLVEMVAPDGYARISGALEITVNEDGSLSIKGPDAYTLESEDGTCVVAVNQETPYFPPWNPPDDEEEVNPDDPDPDDPDNPDNPDDPTDPDNPDNPDNPDDPDNPDNPTPDIPDNPNPGDPDQPGAPDNPNTPSNPSNPGSSSTPGKPTVSTPSKTTSTPSKSTAATTPVVTLARTGDPTAIAVVALNLAVALSTAVAVLVLALRNRRTRERDGS